MAWIAGLKYYAIEFTIVTGNGQVIAGFERETVTVWGSSEFTAKAKLKNLVRKVFPETVVVLIHSCKEIPELRGKIF